LSRIGNLAALTGLIAVVLCGAPAIVLWATFGQDNWLFPADDIAFSLTVMAVIGLGLLAAGLVMTKAGQKQVLVFGAVGLLAVALGVAVSYAALVAALTPPKQPGMMMRPPGARVAVPVR
jgi:hypothetical protein